MSRELTGLFGGESSSSTNDLQEEPSETIPEGWKGLKNLEDGDEDVVHSSIGVNMFYDKPSDQLDTGRGREELAEEVYKHVSGEYDISDWNKYNPEDVVELNVFLLDKLDESEEGRLRGKEVVSYLEGFIEQDGNPGYLEDYDF